MENINPVELKAKLDAGEDLALFDIRESYELDICKIDAIHIPMAEVASRASEFPHDKPVIIVCKSGRRAKAVVNLLSADFNHTNVCLLEGGMLAWINDVDNQLEAY